MNGKNIRYSMICLAIALAIAFSIPLMALNAMAHTPASVELTYDIDTQTLSVAITHSVANPSSHYIMSVEIKKNSEAVSMNNYTSQPSTASFAYIYSVASQEGDILEATATCSLAGSKTGQVEVRAQALPTMTIEVPESGSTIYSTLTTVSGKATGDLANGKVELSVNDGPWLEAIGTESWGLQITLREGQNNVTARVTDSEGNTAEAKVSIISKTDTYPPPPEPHTGEIDSPGFEAVLVLLGAVCLALVLRSRPDRRK